MNKTIKALLILFGIVILSAACTQKASERNDENSSAKTAETKTVTDHNGNVVEIPGNPKRIAALYDKVIGIPLLELGVPIIGSGTHMNPKTQKPFMHGAYELFGSTLEDANIADYGGGGKDTEQIKASNPDLIIGRMFHAKRYDLLSQIAPTVLVDKTKGFDMYRELATWVNKEKEFGQLMKAYQKRLKKVRKKLQLDNKTFVMFSYPNSAKDQIYVYHNSTAPTQVPVGLGLEHIDFVKENLSDKAYEKYTMEVFDELLAADYVVVTYWPVYDQSIEGVKAILDEFIPGWNDIMKRQNSRFIFLEGGWSYPMAFKAYHYVLDEFEKYAL